MVLQGVEPGDMVQNCIITYLGEKVEKKPMFRRGFEDQAEHAAGDAYALMKTALSTYGTILEENTEDGTISGVILSEAANMNPAFLLLWIEGTSIHLAANAKEGLIKQHTAERAVDVFKSALADLESA